MPSPTYRIKLPTAPAYWSWLITPFLLASNSYADELYTMMSIQCYPEIETVQIVIFPVWNVYNMWDPKLRGNDELRYAHIDSIGERTGVYFHGGTKRSKKCNLNSYGFELVGSEIPNRVVVTKDQQVIVDAKLVFHGTISIIGGGPGPYSNPYLYLCVSGTDCIERHYLDKAPVTSFLKVVEEKQ